MVSLTACSERNYMYIVTNIDPICMYICSRLHTGGYRIIIHTYTEYNEASILDDTER